MAIDIKSILGDSQSSIMTPSEIAQLGLRRKAMKMQQERYEEGKTTDAIGSVINNMGTFNTQTEIDSANAVLNELQGNVEGNTSLKAYHTLATTALNDNNNKLGRVKELEKQFDTFDLIDKKRWDSENLQAPDVWNMMNNYNKLALELGGEEYAPFINAGFRSKLAYKTQHFQMIGDALVSGGIISEEEWKAISTGDRKRFAEAKDLATTEIDTQYDYEIKQNNKYDTMMIKIMDAMSESGGDEAFMAQMMKGVSQYAESEGLELPDTNDASDLLQYLTQAKKMSKDNLRLINKKNQAWRGTDKWIDKGKPDFNLDDDDDKQFVDADGDGLDDNTGLSTVEFGAPTKVTTKKTEDVEPSEGFNLESFGKVIGGSFVAGKAIEKSPKVIKAVSNFVSNTGKAVKYMNSEFKLDAKQIESIYKDRGIRRGFESIDKMDVNIKAAENKIKEINLKSKKKRTKYETQQLNSLPKDIERYKLRKSNVNNNMYNYLAKKYKVNPDDIRRMIDAKDKWYAPKHRVKFTKKLPGGASKALGVVFTGQMINDMLNIETESGLAQLGADIETGSATTYAGSKGIKAFVKSGAWKNMIKPEVISKLTPVLQKVAPKLATRLATTGAAIAFPEGVSTAIGIGSAAWLMYDIYALANQYPEIREIIGLDIPE